MRNALLLVLDAVGGVAEARVEARDAALGVKRKHATAYFAYISLGGGGDDGSADAVW